MAFINWGEETPEQLRARRAMEEQLLFEQAAYNSAMAAAAAAGSGSLPKPNVFVGLVDWLAIAPSGTGSEGHDFANFDNWTSASFGSIYNVRRLKIEATSASAHVHNDHPWSDLTIELYDDLPNAWVTVWSKRLTNTNYPGDDSNDYFMDGIDVTFPVVSDVTKIRLTSTPGSDQTYHDWDQDSTIFRFFAEE